MSRASNKSTGSTRKPCASRPGRLTPSEIASLLKEFQEDEAWMEAELDRLEQESKRPKHKQNYKSRKPSKSPTLYPPSRGKPGFGKHAFRSVV